MTGNQIGGLPVTGRKSASVLRTRLAIVLAAQKVFAGQGSLASIEDIAAQAEVSVSTLYKHFANKNDLVTEAFTNAMKSWESWVFENMALETDLMSQLVLPMRLFVRAGKTHPVFAALVANNANEANLRLGTLGATVLQNLKVLRSTGVLNIDNLELRSELLLSLLVHILQKTVLDSKFTAKSADQAIAFALQVLGIDAAESERLVEADIPFSL